MIKNLAIAVIDFYRNTLSLLKIRSCRFYPTCSAYMKEAVQKKGVIKGVFWGVLRLLRCHPFSSGGYDPVP